MDSAGTEKPPSPYALPLLGVVVGTACVMTLFEVLKQIFHSAITIWESHLATIAFTTLLAAVSSYFVLRRYRRLQRILSGLLNVCAYCKKIRNKSGEWIQMEHYLSQHSEVGFSHGICPECAQHHFKSTGRHAAS